MTQNEREFSKEELEYLNTYINLSKDLALNRDKTARRTSIVMEDMLKLEKLIEYAGLYRDDLKTLYIECKISYEFVPIEM